jgi:hypothetical protein
MLIIGCDFHTRYQQIAMAREETGELLVERRLDHASGEVRVSLHKPAESDPWAPGSRGMIALSAVILQLLE